ncbi:hypothetical protein ACPSKX_03265 [Moritella viscosa]
MRTNLLKNCKLLVICLLVTLSFISTANAEGLRIRGQLVKLDNNFATIKTSSGQKIEIKLLDTLTVLLFKDINLKTSLKMLIYQYHQYHLVKIQDAH